LVLGTLYGLKRRILSRDAGKVLALPRIADELTGRVPQDLIDVMHGMDEIRWGRAGDEFIDEQIRDVEAILARRPTNYDVGWHGNSE
jgi:hypothetical protein